jgi:uncharacterized protein (TIGR00255 family)
MRLNMSRQGEKQDLVNASAGGVIASMTGYAAQDGAEATGPGWSWELRSVNGRGLDLRLRLPDGLGALEAPLRKRLSQVVGRGNVTLSLRLTQGRDAGAGGLDPAALDTAFARLAQLRRAAERHAADLAPAGVAEIVALMPQSGAPGLPATETLLADAETLIDAFQAMRAAEGRALLQLLFDQLDRIESLVTAARTAARDRAPAQAARLRTSLAALHEAREGMDEARVAQELALIASKTDVTEELDRLDAHVAAARALLGTGGRVGRKLDFLMQEFNREANTLCSKSQGAALTAIGLDLKLAIDQTREQVQNVE